jgi:5'-nucleotidase
VGAAMEAAINHIPAIAMSAVHRGKIFRFDQAAKLARDLAQMAMAEGMPQGTVLNVNVPQTWSGNVRVTRQSKKVTRNVLQEGTDPRGRNFFWLLEQEHIQELDPQSDYAAVFDGAASITPLHLDRTHEDSLDHLSQWATRLQSDAENEEPAIVTRKSLN